MAGHPMVIVDRETCIGSGMCVFTAPGTFEQDAEAKALVLMPSTDDLDTVRAAVETCPTGALTMTDPVNDDEGT